MRNELIEHYRYVHQNFDETISNISNISIKNLVCYCQVDENEKTVDEELMIRCDYGPTMEECEKGWFHLKCLDLRKIPYPNPEFINDPSGEDNKRF